MSTICGMRIGEKLKRLCDDRRWSQARLLEFVPDVSKSTISFWINGRSRPDLESARKLARALGVPLDWLADDEADFPVPQEAAPEEDRFILQICRKLGHDEAVRRLTLAPEAAGSGPWVPGSVRDLTQSEAARRRQPPAPQPEPPPPPRKPSPRPIWRDEDLGADRPSTPGVEIKITGPELVQDRRPKQPPKGKKKPG